MTETEELIWLILFIVGCVVLVVLVLHDIWGERFFQWLAKKDAEAQREAELKRRMGRK